MGKLILSSGKSCPPSHTKKVQMCLITCVTGVFAVVLLVCTALDNMQMLLMPSEAGENQAAVKEKNMLGERKKEKEQHPEG